jgi:hypothetical protein
MGLTIAVECLSDLQDAATQAVERQ